MSSRQQLLTEVEELMDLAILVESSSDSELSISSNSDDDMDVHDNMKLDDDLDDDDAEVDDLTELHAILTGSRYLQQRLQMGKSRDFIDNFFQNLPERAFRQFTRMSQASFFEIVEIIKDHLVFQNDSFHQQAPVSVQLAVALDRFGHEGNGACVARSLFFWGIGAGTMVNYTDRVVEALHDTFVDQVKWPNVQERVRISDVFAAKGFPGCVGLLDGTLFPLSQKPHLHGETYYDRKSRYSINAQIVCDDKKKIIYCFTGTSVLNSCLLSLFTTVIAI